MLKEKAVRDKQQFIRGADGDHQLHPASGPAFSGPIRVLVPHRRGKQWIAMANRYGKRMQDQKSNIRVFPIQSHIRRQCKKSMVGAGVEWSRGRVLCRKHVSGQGRNHSSALESANIGEPVGLDCLEGGRLLILTCQYLM